MSCRLSCLVLFTSLISNSQRFSRLSFYLSCTNCTNSQHCLYLACFPWLSFVFLHIYFYQWLNASVCFSFPFFSSPFHSLSPSLFFLLISFPFLFHTLSRPITTIYEYLLYSISSYISILYSMFRAYKLSLNALYFLFFFLLKSKQWHSLIGHAAKVWFITPTHFPGLWPMGAS